jgi:hypothetical protein
MYSLSSLAKNAITFATSSEAHKAALQSLEYLQHGAITHMDEIIPAMKAFRRLKE